jgi:CheY-like chemotaxis protein
VGTGLGLATVFGIVKQNNGFINVYSELDKGSRFKIYLPIHESENRTEDDSHENQKIYTGNETVLLVEDEDALLHFTKLILEQMGYTVLTANAPEKALKLSEEYKGDIHVLITDVVMPGMSGRELNGKIKAGRPGIKCLFVSGYTADIIAHNGVLDPDIHFLEKPFTAEELSAKLREVLTR